MKYQNLTSISNKRNTQWSRLESYAEENNRTNYYSILCYRYTVINGNFMTA